MADARIRAFKINIGRLSVRQNNFAREKKVERRIRNTVIISLMMKRAGWNIDYTLKMFNIFLNFSFQRITNKFVNFYLE